MGKQARNCGFVGAGFSCLPFYRARRAAASATEKGQAPLEILKADFAAYGLPGMTAPAKSVARLFPFVLKSRILIVGRDAVHRSKGKLHFVLITTDISERSRDEILSDFSHYPVVQTFTSAELEQFFGIQGAKVVGFAKSNLAQSIYKELKDLRINSPSPHRIPAGSPPIPPSAQKAS